MLALPNEGWIPYKRGVTTCPCPCVGQVPGTVAVPMAREANWLFHRKFFTDLSVSSTTGRFWTFPLAVASQFDSRLSLRIGQPICCTDASSLFCLLWVRMSLSGKPLCSHTFINIMLSIEASCQGGNYLLFFTDSPKQPILWPGEISS